MMGSQKSGLLAAFDNAQVRKLALLGALVSLMPFAGLFASELIKTFDPENTNNLPVDFYVFWGTAKLALQGQALDAFDYLRVAEAAGVSNRDWMPWVYPPGFLLFLTSFGLVPFLAAWAVFTLMSITAIMLATRVFSEDRASVLIAVALAPAMLPFLLVGQTSGLWVAGLLAALACLYTGRPIMAGIFIGLLTLKPQLGILLPFALLAMGAWKTIASAVVTTLVASIVPTFVFGTAYWPKLLAMLSQHGEIVRTEITELFLMISPYATFALFGIPEPLAFMLQWAITILCAVTVFWVWRKKTVSFDLRAAVLLTAIPLSSPYLLHYESAILAPAALFLMRAGVISMDRPITMLLGALMWLGLAPGAIAMMIIGEAELFRPYFFLLALFAFLACLRHVFLPRETLPSTEYIEP